MQQIEQHPPAEGPTRSRRLPPRRRAVSIPESPPPDEPRAGAAEEALALRMDRLENALRHVVRANKEVLRTLDPRRDEATREAMAAFGERVKDGLAGVSRVVRAELREAAERHDELRDEIAALRAEVAELSRIVDHGSEPAPVTRLADVRLRLTRISDELGGREAAR